MVLSADLKSSFFCKGIDNSDFKKAYDTVSRDFLYRILKAMGVGDGFLKWVKLLLTHTKAATLVNGVVSAMQFFHAGVRQGCPLAPLLYLFIGLALYRWLEANNIGITVEDERITADQFADDAKPFLESAADVPRFVAAMEVFYKASGQQLAPTKTKILPLGATTAADFPAYIGEFPVVDKATALGITFTSGTAQPSANWGKVANPAPGTLLAKTLNRCSRLSNCSLSIFGRGMAASGYVSSSLLYSLEFAGIPGGTSEALPAIRGAITKLVQRDLAPTATARAFAGVAGPLLYGHPSTGGFGVLPPAIHTAARRAKWGALLLSSSNPHPWMVVGRKWLLQIQTLYYGRHQPTLLQWLMPPQTSLHVLLARVEVCCPAIHSMLRCLRKMMPVVSHNLQPGRWWFHYPCGATRCY